MFLRSFVGILEAHLAFDIVLLYFIVLLERWAKWPSLLRDIASMLLFVHRYAAIHGWNLVHLIKCFINFFLLLLASRSRSISTLLEIPLRQWLSNLFSYMVSIKLILSFDGAVQSIKFKITRCSISIHLLLSVI